MTGFDFIEQEGTERWRGEAMSKQGGAKQKSYKPVFREDLVHLDARNPYISRTNREGVETLSPHCSVAVHPVENRVLMREVNEDARNLSNHNEGGVFWPVDGQWKTR